MIPSYLKNYNPTNKLSAMTANKTSTNTAIGWVIETDDTTFDDTTQENGCVAHVIKPAAKGGLKTFGELIDGNKAEPSSNIHNLVDPPNVKQFNLKAINNQCHGLVMCTQSIPQTAQAFENIVKMRHNLTFAMASVAAPSPPNNTLGAANPPTNTKEAPE